MTDDWWLTVHTIIKAHQPRPQCGRWGAERFFSSHLSSFWRGNSSTTASTTRLPFPTNSAIDSGCVIVSECSRRVRPDKALSCECDPVPELRPVTFLLYAFYLFLLLFSSANHFTFLSICCTTVADNTICDPLLLSLWSSSFIHRISEPF